MRKLGFLVVLATAGALLGIAPAAAQTTPEVTAFCEAALTTDKAADKVFASERPKQKDIQAFQAALTQIESTAPPEVAATVQAAATSVRTAIQNRQDPFDADPSFEANINAIDEYRYNSCGYTQIDVTGNEYSFEGLPSTAQAGTVAIRFTDTGAELHELAIYRVKGKDSVKKIVGLSEKEQRKKLEEIGGTFAVQGQTSYTIAELTKPGRYALICHLPVGSTSEEAAREAEKDHPKSHAEEGMYATLTVERGSTTTTSSG
jgi:plastocyanin